MIPLDEARCQAIEQSFESTCFDAGDVFTAAWLLSIDAWIWLAGLPEVVAESPIARVAELTREVDEPPLRLAHCIRDLAHGDEARSEDLAAMVASEDPGYRRLLEERLWRTIPADEEEARPRAKARKRR